MKFAVDAACETYKENGHAVSRQRRTFITVLVWVELYGQPAVGMYCADSDMLAL
jgi:hypothetical protein